MTGYAKHALALGQSYPSLHCRAYCSYILSEDSLTEHGFTSTVWQPCAGRGIFAQSLFPAPRCGKLRESVDHSAGPRPCRFGRHSMTPLDAATALARLRARRATARRQRYRPSKLRRYRGGLVALRQAGASYRELAYWLRREYRLHADPTTIRRYLVQLSELHQEALHAELSPGT
jgi:hypothetical protein